MSVRVLAFFDTAYQSTPEIRRFLGDTDPWKALRDARPASRQHFALNLPSTLGQYDLADPNAAGQVVRMARNAGVDGFVIDVLWTGDRYISGGEAMLPACDPDFGLAFRWRNARDDFWKTPASPTERSARGAQLVEALKIGGPLAEGGRVLLIVDEPKELHEPAGVIELLQTTARQMGLTGLYIVANRAEDKGRFLSSGFDALIDPGPAQWHSCDPSNHPNGLTFLEVMAGLRDSVDCLDKFFPYILFAVARMINRERRGKVLPRVFAAFHDWALHPDGGATHLTVGGGKPFDTYLFGLFVENAMLFAHQHFPPGERFVFLESWNGWLTGSQIEPSLLDGDMIYDAARNAIDRGRYVIRTREGGMENGIDEELKRRIELMVEATRSMSSTNQN